MKKVYEIKLAKSGKKLFGTLYRDGKKVYSEVMDKCRMAGCLPPMHPSSIYWDTTKYEVIAQDLVHHLHEHPESYDTIYKMTDNAYNQFK